MLPHRLTRTHAFGLIETTLAIGIVAFAFVAILGLMPVGMTTFNKAMDASTASRIVQQVVTDLQQGTGILSSQPIRYFDDQGDRQSDAGGAEIGDALYHVNTIVQSPTALPGGESFNLATVTVEIVKNPGNQPLKRNPSTSAVIEQPGLSISRFPVLIATQD